MANGCTAGWASDWLNSIIQACCDAHDNALDHTIDWLTFQTGNDAFTRCIEHTPMLPDWPHIFGVLAAMLLAAVCGFVVRGPVGMWLYRFGPKQEASDV